jgi:hypothetical protein
MGSKNEQVALAAVRELLDRGYGKAVQAVDKTERKLDFGALYLEAVRAANASLAAPGDDARVIEGSAVEASCESPTDW